MDRRIQVDAGLWRRASAAAVERAFRLVREGTMKPPITCTMSETDEDGGVLIQFIFPNMTGAIEIGPDCPTHLDHPVFMPLRFVFEDGQIILSCIFEVPPGTMQ